MEKRVEMQRNGEKEKKLKEQDRGGRAYHQKDEERERRKERDSCQC